MFPFIRVNTLLTYFLHIYYIFYRHLELKLRNKNSRSRSLLSKTTGFQCKLITGGLLPSVRLLTTLQPVKRFLCLGFALQHSCLIFTPSKAAYGKSNWSLCRYLSDSKQHMFLIKVYLLHLKKIALSTLKQKLWSSLWLIYHQYFKMCKNIFFA